MKTLCTIGYTKKSLRTFVHLLQSEDVTKVIDVRLRNTSQLAGFAKKDDLAFVLDLCGIVYEHLREVAPTDELVDAYRQSKDWKPFERGYRALLRKRDPLAALETAVGDNASVCLLCAEDDPPHCHRLLLAEYVQGKMPGVEIRHLR